MSDTRIQYHELDESKIVLTYSQDIEKHLAAAKAARRNDAEYRTAFGKRPEFRHAMHVPVIEIYKVCAKLGIPLGELFEPHQQKRIIAELKGPEYRDLRVVNDVRI